MGLLEETTTTTMILCSDKGSQWEGGSQERRNWAGREDVGAQVRQWGVVLLRFIFFSFVSQRGERERGKGGAGSAHQALRIGPFRDEKHHPPAD